MRDLLHDRVDPCAAIELDCLQGILAANVLRAAANIAQETATGADQVLIRRGLISEDRYLAHLARYTGIAFDPLHGLTRDDCPLNDAQLPHAAATGIIPLRLDGEIVRVIAPRHCGARGLSALRNSDPELKARLRITGSANLQQYLSVCGEAALSHLAINALADIDPAYSAADFSSDRAHLNVQRAYRASCIAALLVLPPMISLDLAACMVAVLFLAFYALRIAGCFWARPDETPLPRLRDADLPHYTVMVAMYREAASVAPLLDALTALDYPPEKLDIILVIEPDDLQTRAAIARLGPLPHVQTIIVTSDAPQTKPKALNYALPFARGKFIAVFDAEDLPDPGQLRAALDTFRRHTSDVVCAQAALCIDNETHSFLSRMFAADYAGQFDVYLPGMSQMQLPLPLGGTSNHFRTDVLREIGAWDAFNVTEDADLGFRLARFGYRSVTFTSTTYEEAPIKFNIWLKQRSRWMKGWMQTWQVHMRQPLRCRREMGTAGFITMNVLIGGNLLSALAFPFGLALLLLAIAASVTGVPLQLFTSGYDTLLQLLYGLVFFAGLATTITTTVMGLRARKRVHDARILAWIFVYWSCLAMAAWRALFQYIWTPYHWEKTEHGVIQRKARLQHTTLDAQQSLRIRHDPGQQGRVA